MTIVELFDEKPINNIVGTLAFHPDKVIYVGGYSEKQFESKKMPVLRRYLQKKGYESLVVEYVRVKRESLKDIVEKFERIYSTNANCKFHVEVTGGEDMILVGLGVVCQRHPEIELYQISSKLRTIRPFSITNDDEEKLDIECRNSVEENLLLHGASIISANGSDALPQKYEFDDEFLDDIKIMWDTCCHGIESVPTPSAPNAWNKVTTMLYNLAADTAGRADENLIQVDYTRFKEVYLSGGDAVLLDNYMFYFVRMGLMDYRIEEHFACLQFKNSQVRACLTTAGLILELKTYLICKGLVEPRGGDCLTGVTIDWDGEDDLAANVKYLYDINDPTSTIDTTNEIDVLATCGMLPYFISCKNGRFTAEELYKLYSVGEQFGRGYCKKIIVTTNLTYALGDAKNVMLQRAADMGIHIIDNVHQQTDEEIAGRLKTVMELPKVKLHV